MNKIMPGRKWCSNTCTNMRSRIWLAWNPNEADFKKSEEADQYIHREIILRHSGVIFQFTAVYDLHTISVRTFFWIGLRQLNNNIRGPWLIMDDL